MRERFQVVQQKVVLKQVVWMFWRLPHSYGVWIGQKGMEKDLFCLALIKNWWVSINISSIWFRGCISDISKNLIDALGGISGSSSIFTIAQFM
jgi:hypothetical protein